MNVSANHEPPAASDAPDRTPLTQLAARGAASAAVTRIVGQPAADRGPARVAVAAFQSSV